MSLKTALTTTSTPIVHVKDGEVFANSRDVAEFFGKRHADVLRDIKNLKDEMPDANLRSAYFRGDTYPDANGQHRLCFDMTKDGFTLLVMGYTGAKAMQFKLAYIQRFNEMEQTNSGNTRV